MKLFSGFLYLSKSVERISLIYHMFYDITQTRTKLKNAIAERVIEKNTAPKYGNWAVFFVMKTNLCKWKHDK